MYNVAKDHSKDLESEEETETRGSSLPRSPPRCPELERQCGGETLVVWGLIMTQFPSHLRGSSCALKEALERVVVVVQAPGLRRPSFPPQHSQHL